MASDRHGLILEKMRRAIQRTGRFAARKWLLNRPFSKTATSRLLLVTIDERIPQSQIYPFHFYADALRRQCGTEIREVSIEEYERGNSPAPRDATTVCFQTQFHTPRDELIAIVERLKQQNPEARIVYLDWFAPTDLRLADALDPHIAIYVKKHVLRDRSLYGQPTLGDTNLVDHFSKRFGIAEETRLFPIPPGFLDKLHIGPSFVTADFMLHRFLGASPVVGEKPIDVHARLGVKGTPWYQAMRTECIDALGTIADLNVATGGNLGHVAYLQELQASKVCFSPFGYGEVCWRDYEAIMSGSVLLKPDMSHIETDPDIFVPGKTYVPLRWDLADFEEKVRELVGTPSLREEIANNAFTALHDYVTSERFVTQMRPLIA
ncbi:MAG: glycosyltransferase family 1 protein [Hyphomicrobium zavarzinii]|uniref:glycosyltransferase n=1 Tax=Hyphomicrobium zavarzinii TaxID=48292 RepID=UPI001A4E8ADF|nr:glycosyltransferase [Hyphomicrobium zavarzinii]MBL8845854.1 glycosyltransferase family 1 protein [Hyphomicrobium zavarzinii]